MAANLNIESIAIGEEGMTLRMDANASDMQVLDHRLIDRILTDKQIHVKYLHSRLGEMWNPGKGLVVIPVDQNKFLFQLAHPLDVEQVLNKGPWMYDNASMAIQKISPGTVPKTAVMNDLDLLVQFHEQTRSLRVISLVSWNC
jgi:hypothetical protein